VHQHESFAARTKEVSPLNHLKKLLPFLVGWAVLLYSSSFRDISGLNGAVQVLLFICVVCIPAWRTERMSYVDIGWPWGLVVIGVITFQMSEGNALRIALVSGLYVFMGARMGIGALKLWQIGALARELPRYRYQSVRWERSGETQVAIARQVEVLMQGLANTSYLALPAFVIAANPSASLSLLEFLGFVIACGAFLLESIADLQKAAFIAKAKATGERDQVCNEGLWRYSRHPNYFAEWMVWNGLILMALPSLPHLFDSEHTAVALFITAGLFFASRLMYLTLVYQTGAKPSEFYSVQKRPGYADYQKRTNMFFPGPSKG
jgi:steroid 5-alpha reductase family enzyme